MGQKAMQFHKEIVKQFQLDYLLYLPEAYDTIDRRWPLVLFLHGSGECGSDFEIVKRNGIPKLAGMGKSFPFIAVSPQCPGGSVWENHFEEMNLLIDEMVDKYRADEDRIYLTGLSMGGYGTWDFAMIYPGRFAAIAPICGWSSCPELLKSISELPIWAFHGAKDDIVPVEETRKLVDALRAYGSNIKYTEYPDAGHDAWTATYENPEVYEWLLSQKR
jgi:predicted peptidase